MNRRAKYPIGEQDFKSLREMDYLYVDKTRYIESILKGSKYYFLARPRRFGKSLFLSSLRYFFEGERNLFKGLYIDSVEWDWERYPVLYLDFNRTRYEHLENLDSIMDTVFRNWEEKYGIAQTESDASLRFHSIIEKVHEKSGRQVVILVDEYDKPLVSNLGRQEKYDHYRIKLASLYSNFKSCAEHIRLVFLTGVSRFSKLSVFSDLNNLKDITFSNEYADICGVTEKELSFYFQDGIEALAENEGITYQEACGILKRNYDGYRFARRGSDIYNPWSLLNAMDEGEIANYWAMTGQPTIVAEALKRANVNLEKIFDTYCSPNDLKGFDLLDPNPVALLYQTGYLTIKDYDERLRQFHLGIPNLEVKESFYKELVPFYQKNRVAPTKEVIDVMVRSFFYGDPDAALRALQIYFAGVDYSLKIEDENNFHNAFFLLTDLVGLQTQVESHTSDGRIDIVITTPEYIYIIELKYDHTAESALEQIIDKQYGRKYAMEKQRVCLIGVEFSSAPRCIEGWKIQWER